MTKDENKKKVKDFFEYFSNADVASALALLSDDIVWTAMGTEGGPPMSNVMDKHAISELITVVSKTFTDGLSFKYQGWVAEGDKVAVEILSHGVKPSGIVYHNPYHFLIRFSDEKIVEIKEYMDTLHAKSVFIDNA